PRARIFRSQKMRRTSLTLKTKILTVKFRAVTVRVTPRELGLTVKPYRGGIRHDYKDALVATPASRRRWLLFVLGLSLPLLGVMLFAITEPGARPGPVPAANVPSLEPA